MIVRGTHHLLSDHDNSLDREASVAMIEEVFQAGTEQVDNQDVVKTLLPEVVDIGDASCNQSEPGNLTNTIATRVYSRHPTRILYVRYSSRSCGASLLRGS